MFACISGLGVGWEGRDSTSVSDVWSDLCSPESFAQRSADTSHQPAAHVDPERPQRTGSAQAQQQFLEAAEEALTMAAFAPSALDSARLGMVVGAFDVAAWLDQEPPSNSWLANLDEAACSPSLAAFLAERCVFLSTACASGLDAIGLATQWLRRGSADACLVVAGEIISEPTRQGMRLLRTVSPDQVARPFDQRRNGTVVSAGCVALVLESERHLQERGGEALATVRGYGSATDTASLVAPDPKGRALRDAMEQALASCEVPIDVVCAHASGTQVGDEIELRTIERVVGRPSNRPLVTANKGLLGHTLGASGAFNALQSVLMLREQVVPPVANLKEPMPANRVTLVKEHEVRAKLDTVLTNAVGFGGQNASVLFGASP